MIAIDTNLLVYAHRADAPFHARALALLADLANSGSSWGIPWPCVHEFLAITTHPRIYRPPTPATTALGALEAWMASPSCRLLGEGPGYMELLRRLLIDAKAVGPMIHDARIAALCLHHGVTELWSADRDFSRYGNVTCRNPLRNA
jgi:toxin-antitoxin system PIN domain toxin